MRHPFDSAVATALLGTVLACSASVFAGPVHAPDKPVTISKKIDPSIRFHQQMKSQYQELQPDSALAKSLARATDVHNPNHESCAIYVSQRLSPERITELHADDIQLNDWIWVPPVPGKHPLGFHIGQVSYAGIEKLAAAPDVLRVSSIDYIAKPHNDLGSTRINVDDVNDGIDCIAADGSGVRIAIADSSFDLSHPDLPEAYESWDLTDGTDTETWNSNVSSLVSGHGTHVAGTVAGSGANSNSQYAGAAPAAEICYYKIGNDTTAGAQPADQIESVQRANNMNCDIWTMSYGGNRGFRDGTSAMCQTIDSAFSDGMMCFVSAGNSGTQTFHAEVDLEPGEFAPMNMTLTAETDEALSTTSAVVLLFRGISIDTTPDQVNMNCENLAFNEIFWSYDTDMSLRDTRKHIYAIGVELDPGQSKTYELWVQNNSNEPLKVHGYLSDYSLDDYGGFDNSTNAGTLSTPGLADDAMCIGAWTQRLSWDNYQGTGYSYTDLTADTLSGFSSRGPRIDFEDNGIRKPDIASPGAGTISTRDSEAPKTNSASSEPFIIDDDGEDLDGSGPATYYLMRGTSMACPMAAGATALLIQTYPALTQEEIRTALHSNASAYDTPDHDKGYGLMDILATVQGIEGTCSGDYDNNGRTNIDDILIVIGQWGTHYDIEDLLNVLDDYGCEN